MDLTQLANLGEFIGGVAVLITLIYLVIQVRRGNADSRASARQALIDNWAKGVFEIGRDRELCRIAGSGLADFDGLTDDDKTQFVYMFARFVYNVQNGLLLHKQGILDRETLDEIAGFIATGILCPGGASWWESFPHPQAVREYVADYQERHRDTIVPQDRLTPYAIRVWERRPPVNGA